jgi:hypothetical protein
LVNFSCCANSCWKSELVTLLKALSNCSSTVMALTQSHDDDAFDDPGLWIVFGEQHPDYKVRKQNVRVSSISADQSNHLSSPDALAPICIATNSMIKQRETSLHLSLIPATEAGLPCTKNSNVLGFVHHIVEELNRNRR